MDNKGGCGIIRNQKTKSIMDIFQTLIKKKIPFAVIVDVTSIWHNNKRERLCSPMLRAMHGCNPGLLHSKKTWQKNNFCKRRIKVEPGC